MTSTDGPQVPLSLNKLFTAFDESMQSVNTQREREMGGPQTAIEHHMSGYKQFEKMNGLRRVQMCRKALDALDRRGWDRSFHQRLFHEEYLKSCARIFFKRDGPGAFARSHARLLEVNGWDATPQEILVSTPRRFGKTISVSMFAAAMLFACPNMELSIYSTCKRISQKLLRNVMRFLELIYMELNVPPYKRLRVNQEEVHLQGNEGHGDLRVMNSYPSKIDHILNRIVAKADPPFSHVEIAFPERHGEMPWEREIWGSSIFQGETVFYKPRTYQRDGYVCLALEVSRHQQKSIMQFCEARANAGVPFHANAMYFAYLPFQMVYTSGTFCSKHITEALQYGCVGNSHLLNPALTTPSRLHAFFSSCKNGSSIIQGIPARMQKANTAEWGARMSQSLLLPLPQASLPTQPKAKEEPVNEAALKFQQCMLTSVRQPTVKISPLPLHLIRPQASVPK